MTWSISIPILWHPIHTLLFIFSIFPFEIMTTDIERILEKKTLLCEFLSKHPYILISCYQVLLLNIELQYPLVMFARHFSSLNQHHVEIPHLENKGIVFKARLVCTAWYKNGRAHSLSGMTMAYLESFHATTKTWSRPCFIRPFKPGAH